MAGAERLQFLKAICRETAWQPGAAATGHHLPLVSLNTLRAARGLSWCGTAAAARRLSGRRDCQRTRWRCLAALSDTPK